MPQAHSFWITVGPTDSQQCPAQPKPSGAIAPTHDPEGSGYGLLRA